MECDPHPDKLSTEDDAIVQIAEIESVVPNHENENDERIQQSERVSNDNDVCQMSVEELRNLCLQKDEHIKRLKELLEEKTDSKQNLEQLVEAQNNFEKRLKQQQLESSRKENILLMRLSLKEQELQECLTQIDTLRQLRLPTNTQLESYLLDPALNYMFERMKKEVDSANTNAEEMQRELNAWKFSADSITGKRLMAKCRQLHQENEELGKMISSGKIAKLEGGLAMHKKYSEELKKSQSEIEEVLMEMEEDIEGFQNTVYYLQQQVKEEKEKSAELGSLTRSPSATNEPQANINDDTNNSSIASTE